MDLCKLNIVIGCMVFSVMKLHAHVIGHAGMVQLLSNCASEVFCTTRMLIRAIGRKMLMDVKSIVSTKQFHWITDPIDVHLIYAFLTFLYVQFPCFSALCNDDANGNVPLGKSCNRYWQCQGGYPRLQRCPAMLVFDRKSLRCVVPPTEDCDIPTTQQPIEGDLQDAPSPGRGNDNADSFQHQRQFEQNDNDGVLPHLLRNTLSHRNP